MPAPFIHTSPQLQLLFRCNTCGQVDAYTQADATPAHCGHLMILQRPMFFGGDPNRRRLIMLQVKREFTPSGFPATDRDWPRHWNPAYELWHFKAGEARTTGERLGWFGQGLLGWEWISMPGCTPREGVAASKEEAANRLWEIIQS